MSGTYLLLDSWSKPLAKGTPCPPYREGQLHLRLPEGQMPLVTGHEIVQVLRTDNDDRPMKCRLLSSGRDDVTLEPMEVLDPALRNNLRIPVCFDSFLYPLTGGRLPIRSVDLSCGGIAFYGPQGLQVDQEVELVIPITEQPLIVRGRLLRVSELKNDQALYAARFVAQCHDEEVLLRRAVFGVQLHSGRDGQAT